MSSIHHTMSSFSGCDDFAISFFTDLVTYPAEYRGAFFSAYDIEKSEVEVFCE